LRLVWNDGALDDLEKIRGYIEGDNPLAAARVVWRLRGGLEQLTEFPQMGRVGRVPETRELVFPDLRYVAVYRIYPNSDVIEILNIIHTAREYPPKA
jgi:addiction module RelE/StbE family toxin